MPTRFLLYLCFCLPAWGLTQTTVGGTVVDARGEPLIGVTIRVVQGTSGTVSDYTGTFTLTIDDPATAKLNVSYLGYESQIVPLAGRTQLTITLEESAFELETVAVTALGIERETKSLTYARQSVDPDNLVQARTQNLTSALAGKVAGVQVTGGATPNSSNRVVIRGASSITGNNQPLYVVDGIPLDNSAGDDNVSVWNDGDDIDYGNPISNINPDDIESIEVLKGPNAAALYGSRAANGVIILTTKQGKRGEGLGISINSNLQFTDNIQYLRYQNVYGAGNQFRLTNGSPAQTDRDTGLPIPGFHTRSYGDPMLGFPVQGYNGEETVYAPQPNNVSEYFQTGAVLTNTISLSQGGEEGNFRLAYTNTTGDFVLPGFEEQQRHNLTFRASREFGTRLSVDASVLYTNDRVDNRIYQNGSDRNPLYNLIYLHRNLNRADLSPYADENGNAFTFNGPFINPLWNLNENTNQDVSNRLIGRIQLSYELLPSLLARVRLMTDINQVEGDEFNNVGAPYDPDGYYRTFNRNNRNYNYEGLLTYRLRGDRKISVVATAGGNYFDRSIGLRDSRINSLLLRGLPSLANAAAPPEVLEQELNDRILSAFGSASFGLNNTYYLDLTARNDWSSTLPADNNSYFYPSVGGSFVFSELLPTNNILSFGKLRASWAQVGNDAQPYQTLTNFRYGGIYNGNPWVATDRIRGNPDLLPETTTSQEFGVELMLWQKRVSLNATYYDGNTKNQIISAQVPAASGFAAQLFNAGEIRNYGWELAGAVTPIDGAFEWTVDLNWARNNSEVLSLLDGVDRFLLRQWFSLGIYAEVGEPYGVIRGNAPLRDENGAILVNPNGRIQVDRDAELGNVTPDWIGGVRNSLRWKGINLSVLFDFRKGGDLYSGTMVRATNFGVTEETLEGRDAFYFSSIVLGENNNERRGVGLFGNDYDNSDRPRGAIYPNSFIGVRDPDTGEIVAGDPNVNYISPQNFFFDAGSNQERFTYDASFVKLREVVLGYDLPPKLLERLPLQSARVSLVGRNLAILHQNTPEGIDPESSTTSGNGQGIEYAAFPPAATYGVNLQLSF
jgi:TonB-linked SusC/RagA family outer membrane protein